MNLPARQVISTAHRARVLRALGITAWTRRGPVADALRIGAGVDVDVDAAATSAAGSRTCVVVLAQGCSTRALDLLGRALTACGASLARAARVSVREGQLTDVPAANAYLVFGEAQAHALGRSLPGEVMQRAQIVLVDELGLVLTNAGAKRRLWRALRDLRQGLVAGSG